MNDKQAKLLLHYCISWFCYIGKPAYLSTPKFLAGCHYNEEEISRQLKNMIGYWPVRKNGNKFATGQLLKKPVDVVKGRILAGWARKSPKPWWDLRWFRCWLDGWLSCWSEVTRIGVCPARLRSVGVIQFIFHVLRLESHQHNMSCIKKNYDEILTNFEDPLI